MSHAHEIQAICTTVRHARRVVNRANPGSDAMAQDRLDAALNEFASIACDPWADLPPLIQLLTHWAQEGAPILRDRIATSDPCPTPPVLADRSRAAKTIVGIMRRLIAAGAAAVLAACMATPRVDAKQYTWWVMAAGDMATCEPAPDGIAPRDLEDYDRSLGIEPRTHIYRADDGGVLAVIVHAAEDEQDSFTGFYPSEDNCLRMQRTQQENGKLANPD